MKQKMASILSIGSVVTAFLASCCALPLTLAFLGIAGLGLASSLSPYRWIFLLATLALLGSAFYFVYAKKDGCLVKSQDGCCSTRSQKVSKIFLWVALGITLVFLLGPYVYVALAS